MEDDLEKEEERERRGTLFIIYYTNHQPAAAECNIHIYLHINILQ